MSIESSSLFGLEVELESLGEPVELELAGWEESVDVGGGGPGQDRLRGCRGKIPDDSSLNSYQRLKDDSI